MSPWIPVSERLPIISEGIEVTDGFSIKQAWCWDNINGGIYINVDDKDREFSPLWWRYYPNSKIEMDLEKYTYKPSLPKETNE